MIVSFKKFNSYFFAASEHKNQLKFQNFVIGWRSNLDCFVAHWHDKKRPIVSHFNHRLWTPNKTQMFLAKIGNGLQLKVWSIGATPSAHFLSPCNNSLCKYTIRDSKIIKRGMNSFYMRLHKDFELIMSPASQKSHCIKTHNFHTKQSETIQPLCSTYLAKKFKFSRMNQWTFKQIFTI